MSTRSIKPSRTVHFTVNGAPVAATVEPRTHLGDFLRDTLRLTGTHLGCEHGVCGACTVLADGVPIRSCITFIGACEEMSVTTIEGFADDPDMAKLRDAFAREHGLQCGFCTPGMLITARDIVQRFADADEQKIRVELSGNLCRCTGYAGIVKAVRDVARSSARDTAREQARAPGITAWPVAVATERHEQIRFEPLDTGTEVAPASHGEASFQVGDHRPGWNRFEESFVIDSGIAEVWSAFEDTLLVASCFDGVEVIEHTAANVKARMTVGIGPISASFVGAASIERDDGSYVGRIVGAGSDQRSGTRTRGEISYCLTELGDTRTQVSIAADYSLQGAFAQFSRSTVAQEVGRAMIRDFADNLNARLSGIGPQGTAARRGRSLSALRLTRIALAHLASRLRFVLYRR